MIGQALPGATVEVEEYQRKGRDGDETFIKQPKGDGFAPRSGGGGSSPSSGGGGGGGSDKNATFSASYAKDMIVAEANKSGTVDISRWAVLATAVHDWLTDKLPSTPAAPAAAPSAPTAPVTPAKQEVDLEVLNGLLEVNGLAGAIADPAVGMGKVLAEYLEAGMDGDAFIRNLQKIYTPKPDDDKLPM